MSSVLICAVVLLACWGVGGGLDRLRWIPLPALGEEPCGLDALWRVMLGTGLGMALSGTAILLVGALAFPPAWVVMSLTLGLATVGLAVLPWKLLPVPRDWVVLLLLLVSFTMLMLHALVAFHPEFDIDELTYHLTVPKAWMLSGRLRQFPFEPHSDFHFHSQMISLWSFLLAPMDTISPRLLELSRTAIAAFGAGLIVARWSGNRAGALATTLLILNEDVARYAVTGQVDAGQSLYAILGLAVLGRWLASPSERRWAVLGSALLGGVLAVKNVGWFLMGTGLVAAAAIRIVQRRASNDWRGVARDAACLLLPWLITVGPWIIRSTINTGNPIYPFWSGLIPVNEASAPGYYWLYKYYEPPPNATWLSIIPSAAELYVIRSNVRLTNANGAMVWALMGLLALIVLRRRAIATPPTYWLLVLTSLLLIPAQFKSPFGRFFIASGFVALCGALPALVRVVHLRARGSAIAFACGSILLVMAGLRCVDTHRYRHPGTRSVENWKSLPPLTFEGRLDWLRAHEPAGIDALEALQSLPPDALPTVSVTSHALLLADRPFLPNVQCVAREVIISLTMQGWTDQQILDRLEHERITHIVTTVDYNEEDRLRSFASAHLRLLRETQAGVRIFAIEYSGGSLDRGNPQAVKKTAD